MTTAFQTVFDNAEQLSFNRRRKVATTTSRSGVVKATSIGGQVWEFEVLLPSGPAWTEYRPLIEKMEALDRVTIGQVQLNKAGQEWITGYRGDLTNITAVTVSYSSGNTVTITGGATLGSGYRFKSGDVIQLGTTGAVYSVVDDVAYNATTVTLHRPVREAAGTYTLRVGPNVVWNVLCVSFPKWNLFSRDQVGWDGPFVFVEAI
jgi:Cu/Ag efflux pump CusA